MGRTPYFSGADASTSHRDQARVVARRLAAGGELGYDVLFSAASFILRDGRQPRDSVVVEEARRRRAACLAACESNRFRLSPLAGAGAADEGATVHPIGGRS